MFLHPKMDFNPMLIELKFKKRAPQEIEGQIPFLGEKFVPCRKDTNAQDKVNAVMGALRFISEGNLDLAALAKKI